MLRGYGGRKLQDTKPKWKLILPLQVKMMSKGLYNKRKAQESLHPLLDAEGGAVSWDEGKAELLHAFFASLQSSGCPDPRTGS